MSQYVTKIRTDQGDKQIDYNALANLPTISNPNLLINGDFRVWQRGTSFSNFANKYTADRWYIANANGNTSLVEKSEDVPSGEFMRYSMHIVETNVENSYLRYTFDYYIKGDFTLSFWYKSNVNFNSYMKNNGAMMHLFKSNASGVWTKAVINFSATALNCIEIIRALPIGEVYITGVKLEYGDTATPFMPRLYDEEFLLCLRYYQTVNCRLTMTVYSAERADGSYYFQVPMRDVPGAVTVNNMTYFDPETNDFIESVEPVANFGHISNKYVLIRMNKNANDTFIIGQSRNALVNLSIDAEIY